MDGYHLFIKTAFGLEKRRLGKSIRISRSGKETGTRIRISGTAGKSERERESDKEFILKRCGEKERQPRV